MSDRRNIQKNQYNKYLHDRTNYRLHNIPMKSEF